MPKRPLHNLNFIIKWMKGVKWGRAAFEGQVSSFLHVD